MAFPRPRSRRRFNALSDGRLSRTPPPWHFSEVLPARNFAGCHSIYTPLDDAEEFVLAFVRGLEAGVYFISRGNTSLELTRVRLAGKKPGLKVFLVGLNSAALCAELSSRKAKLACKPSQKARINDFRQKPIGSKKDRRSFFERTSIRARQSLVYTTLSLFRYGREANREKKNNHFQFDKFDFSHPGPWYRTWGKSKSVSIKKLIYAVNGGNFFAPYHSSESKENNRFELNVNKLKRLVMVGWRNV